MMAALQDSLALLKERGRRRSTSRTCPPDDPKVYAMLQTGGHRRRLPGGEPRADGHAAAHEARRTSTTSWSRSRSSGPGPSWGRWSTRTCDRRAGSEPVVYAHPCLEPILKRTLGVPLFQEQLLRMAMMVAGFTGGRGGGAAPRDGLQALRRSAWRDVEVKLREGMARERDHGRDRGRDRALDHVLRALRLPGVARGVASRCSPTPART